MVDLQAENNEVSFDDVVTARRAAEDERQKRQLRFLLVPGSTSLALWHSLTIILVLIAVIISPMDMAFSYDPFFKKIKWLSQILDIFFIFDMVLKFFVATSAHGRLETDHFHLAKGYLKSWFLPDLLINFPWDLVLSDSSGKSRKLAKALKLPKALRVTRLLRVAGDEAHYFGTMANIGGILLMGHLCSCLFAMVLIDCGEDYTECPDVLTVYLQGLSVGIASLAGSDGWARFFPLTDSQVSGLSDPALAAEGVESSAAIAWIGKPEAEIIAAMTNLAGFCLLATLFSNISHAMDQRNHHTRLFHNRLEILKAAHQQHPIPDELYHRVKRHYYYVWSCGSDTAKAILGDVTLSVDLRRQLAYTFYGHLLLQVPFLETADQAFIKHICEFVEMEILAAGDRVASVGEVATELYFVAAGKVQMVLPAEGDGEDTVIKVLDEGSFFGELGLLFPESQHKVNLVAVLPGWLLVIDRSTIESICSEELLETFRSVAVERLQSTKYAVPLELSKDVMGQGESSGQVSTAKENAGLPPNQSQSETQAKVGSSPTEQRISSPDSGPVSDQVEEDNFEMPPTAENNLLLAPPPPPPHEQRASVLSNVSSISKPAWVSSRRRPNPMDTGFSARRGSVLPQSMSPQVSMNGMENGVMRRTSTTSFGQLSDDDLGRRLSSMSFASQGPNMTPQSSMLSNGGDTLPLFEMFSTKVDNGLERLSSIAVTMSRQITLLEARVSAQDGRATLPPIVPKKVSASDLEARADLPWSVPEEG